MSIYENCTNVINTEKSLQRVVNNGKSYIEDFILVYSEEEWEEIRLNEEAEMDQYDVDYDEYEDYYNED